MSRKIKTKLVYGVGINDADYVVTEYETIGNVDGKRKKRLMKFTYLHLERF